MLRRKALAWIFIATVTLGLVPGPAGADPTPAPIRAFAWWIPVWENPKHLSGLYIAIDPVTGRPITPAPDQIGGWNTQRALDAFRAPTRPLTVQKLRSGGQIVHLNGAFRSFAVARVAPDGTVVTKCVP